MTIEHPLIGKVCQWRTMDYGKIVWTRPEDLLAWRYDPFALEPKVSGPPPRPSRYGMPVIKWKYVDESPFLKEWNVLHDPPRIKYTIFPVEAVSFRVKLKGTNKMIGPTMTYLKCLIDRPDGDIPDVEWLRDSWLEENTLVPYDKDVAKRLKERLFPARE